MDGQGAPARARILVVDDEDMVRSVAVRILERMGGYEAVGVPGGAEAIALVEGDPRPVDAIVVDLSMPGMDGATAIAELRARRPGLPALVSSGYDREESLARCPQDPPPHFVAKPFTPDSLLAAVRGVLAAG